jgi:hypothetical protein
VRLALESPDEIRQSRTDADVLLFYKAVGTRRWVCAVARHDPGQAFLVTAYPTDAIKEGVEHVCEETGEEVVLMKDAAGRVIGFEKLNFSIPETDRLRVETTPA